MGGIGSGSGYRWSKKTYLEETRRIDINFMKKNGWLRPGASGALSWSCGDTPTGSIRFLTLYDKLILTYKYREYDDDWQSMEEHVLFDRTPCNYGGERLGFFALIAIGA